MPSGRAWRRVALSFFLVCLSTQPSAAVDWSAGDEHAGRRLYDEGVDEHGVPIKGTVQGDIAVTGAQFSCVSCHRPSGFGSSEGGYYVPPVTGPILFNPASTDRIERFREMFQEAQPSSFWAQVRQPRQRPAYNAASFARVLRAGVDPSGETLSPVMPRYDISDRDMANLLAFMQGLSAEIDAGVDETQIHFATIVTADADPAARAAMLETMALFFKWMNKDTEGDLKHPAFSPGYRSEFLSAYRNWNLHVWDLSGPPQTWPTQLETYYRGQPVFAVISSLIRGPWQKIGDFCDTKRLPCLFPNTELPRIENPDHAYTLYFSGGLALEARVLARHIPTLAQAPTRIHHIWRADPYGEVPAAEFAAALGERAPGIAIVGHAYTDEADLEAVLRAVEQDTEDAAVVLWPGLEAAATVSALSRTKLNARLIALPADALASARESLSGELAARVVFTYPYEVPTHYHPRKFRVRAWMHSRGLKVTHPRLQYQTYYALTLVQYGLLHLLSDFHRDYLVELIEHEAENKLNPGTHPSLALGPGQRFASKGAYIVRIDESSKGGIAAVSEWIVP